jgi:hypothetical protein
MKPKVPSKYDMVALLESALLEIALERGSFQLDIGIRVYIEDGKLCIEWDDGVVTRKSITLLGVRPS